jgi:hypothetical protein
LIDFTQIAPRRAKMAAKHQLPKVLFGTSSLGNLFVELTHEV